MQIRRIVTTVEETPGEHGQVSRMARRVAVAAVVVNPLAGRYEENLSDLIADGEELGRLLAGRALAALPGATFGCFGRGAIVGQAGELEHAAALVHSRFGMAVQKAVGGKEIIPSPKKLGGPGTTIAVPVRPGCGPGHSVLVDSVDFVEVRIPGHPQDDEAVVVLAATDAGNPVAG